MNAKREKRMSERKIADCIICAGWRSSEESPHVMLEECIRNYLAGGWILYGNPFGSSETIYQAMIKYED